MPRFKNASRYVIIKTARECGLSVSVDGDEIEIDSDKWHTAAWRITFNSGSGYWQVQQWNEHSDDSKHDDEGFWGRGICSLRNITQVGMFCNIMTSMFQLRAKRKE